MSRPRKLDGLLERAQAIATARRLPSPARRRAIRRRAGVNLRDVAEVLGTTAMSVSRWERGICEPSIEMAAAYREVLDALEEAAG